MDPEKREALAARDAEERPTHGIRCRNCTLLLEQCQCSAKFPHLRSRTTYQVLAPRAPTKPFSFFFDEVSASLHREHRTASSSEIALLLRQQWTQLGAAAKAKYHALAKADEERFQRERDEAVQNAKRIQQHEEEVNLPSGKTVKIIRSQSASRRSRPPRSADDARADDDDDGDDNDDDDDDDDASNAMTPRSKSTTARSLEHRRQRRPVKLLLPTDKGPVRASEPPAPAFHGKDSLPVPPMRKPSPRLRLPSVRSRGATSNNNESLPDDNHSKSSRTTTRRVSASMGQAPRHSAPVVDAHAVLETLELQSNVGSGLFQGSRRRRPGPTSKRKVTLPRLEVELVAKPAHFLNAEGRLEEGVEERYVWTACWPQASSGGWTCVVGVCAKDLSRGR